MDTDLRVKNLTELAHRFVALHHPMLRPEDPLAEQFRRSFLLGMQTGIEAVVDEMRKPEESARLGVEDLYNTLGLMLAPKQEGKPS